MQFGGWAAGCPSPCGAHMEKLNRVLKDGYTPEAQDKWITQPNNNLMRAFREEGKLKSHTRVKFRPSPRSFPGRETDWASGKKENINLKSKLTK